MKKTKELKQKVLEFMQNRNTAPLSTNDFFFEFVCEYGKTGMFAKDYFEFDIDSVPRARRFVKKAYWIGVNNRKEVEKDFIDSFSLKNNLI